jgi:hypothetical protein
LGSSEVRKQALAQGLIMCCSVSQGAIEKLQQFLAGPDISAEEKALAFYLLGKAYLTRGRLLEVCGPQFLP